MISWVFVQLQIAVLLNLCIKFQHSVCHFSGWISDRNLADIGVANATTRHLGIQRVVRGTMAGVALVRTARETFLVRAFPPKDR
jgi:hypothetical protein